MTVRCVNHPAAPAMTTCSYCSAPICEKCLFYYEGVVYCCQACAIKAKSMGVDLRSKLDRSRGLRGLVAWIIRTAITLALIALLLDFLNINLPYVPNFF